MRRARRWLLSLVVGLAAAWAAGCGGGSGVSDDAGAPPDLAPAGDLRPPPIGPAGDSDQVPTVDNVERRYLLSVPESAVAAMAAGPVPLVIALHGAGDTPDNFSAALRLPAWASKHAFVLAVPAGWGNAWFISPQEGWPGDDGQSNGLLNDIHLLQRIIADTAAAYYLDAKRIYVVGHSRGGALTGLLASASMNDKPYGGAYVSPFAAYAISAGYNAFGAGGVDLTKSGPKRPIWIAHGDADGTVTIEQGQGFADELTQAGWPVTFTPVAGVGHRWMWQPAYGQSLDDLWDFFAKNPRP